MRSCLRGESKHDFEPGGEFSNARALQRIKGDYDRCPLAGVRDAPENTVAIVLGLAGDIKLSDEFRLAGRPDRKMDVPCAPRIGDGLDGAEQVFARRSGEKPPETLKVRVPDLAVAAL